MCCYNTCTISWLEQGRTSCYRIRNASMLGKSWAADGNQKKMIFHSEASVSAQVKKKTSHLEAPSTFSIRATGQIPNINTTVLEWSSPNLKSFEICICLLATLLVLFFDFLLNFLQLTTIIPVSGQHLWKPRKISSKQFYI